MLYPFIFKPFYREMIWGGTDILPFKGFPEDTRKIGESWEISQVENRFSVIENGALAGKKIDELIEEYDARLLGNKALRQSGRLFPLLVKFIDARDNLSIQVHPNDQMAQLHHQSCGKTEMWYVVKASPDAVLYSGFSQPIDADEYVRRVADDSITDVLQKYHVKAGDVFFLPAGRIHALCSGCFIAEIQQTSDLTYRIYDYNRQDANGNTRKLHTELAKEAIDFTFYPDYQTHYVPVENEAVQLVQCPYFTTNLLNINQIKQRDFSSLDSFVIYMCLNGKAGLTDDKSNTIVVRQGQTILIPADTIHLTITPDPSTQFLETYLTD